MPDPAPTQPEALSEEGLREKEARLEMATGTILTSLPWHAEHPEDSTPGYHSGIVWGGHEGEHVIVEHPLPPLADFIANAPEDVATLLAELRRVQGAIEKLHVPEVAPRGRSWCFRCGTASPCETLRIIRGEPDA